MSARWCAEEDALLRRLYGEGRPVREIAQRLGRSTDAVTSRRRWLGVEPRRVQWSERHDAVVLAATRAGIPAAVIAAQLRVPPGRVRYRRRRLLKARPGTRSYTRQEDAAVRRQWGDGGDLEALAARLGRSSEALRLRAQALGAHQPQRRRRWSEREDDVLRAGYRAGFRCARIAALLPGRTVGAVEARAGKLGLRNYGRRWSSRDDERLLALTASGISLEEAAVRLVRTPEALRQRTRRLGLAPPPAGATVRAAQRWTAEEDAVLRAWPEASPAVLARALHRSDQAVRLRMRRLGLTARRQRTPHYALPAHAGLSPAERLAAQRALQAPGSGQWLALAARLRMSPGELRRALAEVPNDEERGNAA